jgi:hypothetical protein
MAEKEYMHNPVWIVTINGDELQTAFPSEEKANFFMNKIDAESFLLHSEVKKIPIYDSVDDAVHDAKVYYGK